MNKTHEKLLVAALAGLVIASAAAYAVQPALAEGYYVDGPAQVVDVAKWDVLNVRKWPASYSKKVGALTPNSHIWVVRCIDKEDTADWCLVQRGNLEGWVNSNFIEITYDD